MVEARLSSGSVGGLVPSKQSAEIPGTDNIVFAYHLHTFVLFVCLFFFLRENQKKEICSMWSY